MREWSFLFGKERYEISFFFDLEDWGLGIMSWWGGIKFIHIQFLCFSVIFYKWWGSITNEDN